VKKVVKTITKPTLRTISEGISQTMVFTSVNPNGVTIAKPKVKTHLITVNGRILFH